MARLHDANKNTSKKLQNFSNDKSELLALSIKEVNLVFDNLNNTFEPSFVNKRLKISEYTLEIWVFGQTFNKNAQKF